MISVRIGQFPKQSRTKNNKDPPPTPHHHSSPTLHTHPPKRQQKQKQQQKQQNKQKTKQTKNSTTKPNNNRNKTTRQNNKNKTPRKSKHFLQCSTLPSSTDTSMKKISPQHDRLTCIRLLYLTGFSFWVCFLITIQPNRCSTGHAVVLCVWVLF